MKLRSLPSQRLADDDEPDRADERFGTLLMNGHADMEHSISRPTTRKKGVAECALLHAAMPAFQLVEGLWGSMEE